MVSYIAPMSEIGTVHLRFTKAQREKLKEWKGERTWEEYFLELAGADTDREIKTVEDGIIRSQKVAIKK